MYKYPTCVRCKIMDGHIYSRICPQCGFPTTQITYDKELHADFIGVHELATCKRIVANGGFYISDKYECNDGTIWHHMYDRVPEGYLECFIELYTEEHSEQLQKCKSWDKAYKFLNSLKYREKRLVPHRKPKKIHSQIWAYLE